jgi:hypothetical protein
MSNPGESMSPQNDKANDVLDRALTALREAPIGSPSPELLDSAIEALQARSRGSQTRPFRAPSSVQSRLIRFGVAAAVLLAALAGGLWLIDRSASISFAQVVEKVSKAKSVSFVLRQKLGHQPELDSRMFIRGDILRYEIADMLVLIIDAAQRTGLELDVPRKIAKHLDLAGRVPAEALQDPIERLRNLKENVKDHVVQLADEQLDDRKCHVFEVKGVREASFLMPDRFKLWVDAKTALPVKIHAEDERNSLLYEQFRWDEPLRDELFSLTVPRGYVLEEFRPAVINPGRIYYHQGWVELRWIAPDGQKPELQFIPRFAPESESYVSERAELSPDGRYLAIAYTHSTRKGLYPPNRVLLWDRTQPKEPAVEAYIRPDGELQSWQFSADGSRLYVNWWEAIPPRKGPAWHTGTDVVELQSKTKQPVTLPTYKDKDGEQRAMQLGAASADGQTYLVVGDGLHLASAAGKIVRTLTGPDAHIFIPSVRVSPDGSRALWVAQHPSDRSHRLLVVSLAGGQPKELVPPGKSTDVRARWSPDGNRIAYTCRLLDPANPPFDRGPETYLKVVDADGSTATTLRTEKVHPKGPSLELTAWR